MEPTRDVGRIDVMPEPLDRSLAQAGKPLRSSSIHRPRPDRDRCSPDIPEGSRALSWARRQATAKSRGLRLAITGLGGVSAAALLAVTVVPTVATANPAPRKARPNYANPLARARVTPERIDMGVDYSGTGTLTSIGAARVTYVGTKNTGWPGAFIEYHLLKGSRARSYVYYAEGVRPARGIKVGRIIHKGQPVARLIRGWSSGIEIGWAAGIGTETLAEERGQQTFPTPAGKNFSAFIASLGAPPGKPGVVAGPRGDQDPGFP